MPFFLVGATRTVWGFLRAIPVGLDGRAYSNGHGFRGTIIQ